MMFTPPLPPANAEMGPDNSKVPVPSMVAVGLETWPFARVRIFASVSAVFQTHKSDMSVSEFAAPANFKADVLPTVAAVVLPKRTPLVKSALLFAVTLDRVSGAPVSGIK